MPENKKSFKNVAVVTDDHERLRHLAQAENRSMAGQLTHLIRKAYADAFPSETSGAYSESA